VSWLSILWKNIKGGKTDAEVVFGLVVGGLSRKQKLDLAQKLTAVQFAVDMASSVTQDDRVKEARVWVNGALDILGE
jgi:hypothetical protein